MDAPVPSLRLVPELIPGPLWGHSGARLLPQSRWRRVRAAEVERAGNRCEVCGRPGRDPATKKGAVLIAHERWRYDVTSEPAVALLWTIRMQCRPCDAGTHIGLADSQGRGDLARATLARVNRITRADVELLVEGVFEGWAQLSSVGSWTAVVHPPLLERHPDLDVVARTPVRTGG